MSLLRKTTFYTTLFFGTLLIAATLISLIANSGLWYFKILNFPRQQVLGLLFLCLILLAVSRPKRNRATRLFFAGLVSSFLLQAYLLFPYIPFAANTVAEAAEKPGGRDSTISIVVANVLMHNRETKKLLAMVREISPTFVLAMEVNDRWIERLSVLESDYPYRLIEAHDNTYGMALYSKYPLKSPQKLHLSNDKVPSFLTDVAPPGGREFRLFTLHPVPPKPSEHPDNMGEEEVALMRAARIVTAKPGPTLVAGDFNDVGWSHNSQVFEKISGLNDVRRGRGFFNTFDAHSWLMRWPLDYVYVSSEFKVVDVQRLDGFGSDHFPYYVELVIEP